MNAMTYKGYMARVEFDSDDEIFVGHVAGIRDRVGLHADTVADLKEAFYEAVDDYLETCAKTGKTPQKTYSGKMMLRVSPDIHRKAAIAAELAGKSLNQWSEEIIEKAVKRKEPSTA